MDNKTNFPKAEFAGIKPFGEARQNLMAAYSLRKQAKDWASGSVSGFPLSLTALAVDTTSLVDDTHPFDGLRKLCWLAPTVPIAAYGHL